MLLKASLWKSLKSIKPAIPQGLQVFYFIDNSQNFQNCTKLTWHFMLRKKAPWNILQSFTRQINNYKTELFNKNITITTQRIIDHIKGNDLSRTTVVFEIEILFCKPLYIVTRKWSLNFKEWIYQKGENYFVVKEIFSFSRVLKCLDFNKNNFFIIVCLNNLT